MQINIIINLIQIFFFVEVEEIQVSILRLLLNATDAPNYQDSSRALFLAKFRTFLKEHAPGSRVSHSGKEK